MGPGLSRLAQVSRNAGRPDAELEQATPKDHGTVRSKEVSDYSPTPVDRPPEGHLGGRHSCVPVGALAKSLLVGNAFSPAINSTMSRFTVISREE